MYCHNCGKQIADVSHFCPECGAEQVITEKKAEPDSIFTDSEQKTGPLSMNKSESAEEKSIPDEKSKRISRLSFISLVISILGIFGFIGSILGIVDICINRKTRHFFSVLAIILGIFVTFVSLPSTSPESVVSKANNVPNGVVAMSAQDFKTSCVPFDYDRFARNPDNFVGTNVVMHGQVAQVVTDEKGKRYFKVFITDDTGMVSADMVFVYDKRGITERILEDDIVTVYATFEGSIPTTTNTHGTDV